LSCRLCQIPNDEPLIYEDDVCYIVPTKENKGHDLRVMVVLKRHTAEPSVKEFVHCIDRLRVFMNSNCKTKDYHIVFGTHATIPEHFHTIGCDDIVNESEQLMFDSERVVLNSPVKNVLIGIPTHNESAHIYDIVTKAKRFGYVVVIDNGSSDDTAIVARKAGAIADFYTWSGYGLALQEIFNFAKYNKIDVLITLDGDGQHNPDEIPRFLQKIQSADIVVGNRFKEDSNTPLHRKAIIKGINTIYGIGDSQNGFRAYNRLAIENIHITEEGMGASLEILNRAKEFGLVIAEVPCTVTYSKKRSFSSDLRHGVSLLETIFWGVIWARPYTFLGIPASIFLLSSIICGSIVIINYADQHYFILNVAVVAGMSFIIGILLTAATFFITIQRRLLKEIRK